MIADPFDLDRPLLQFAPGDLWTIRDACEGTQIFGGTGSGKTSGSGRAIARSFMSNGFGGLVLCAKPEERRLWERYARETGREADLVIFAPDQPYRFNFLDYELRRTDAGGGQTENIVNLFDVALEVVEGQQQQEGGDKFWPRAMQQMLRNAIDVMAIAGVPITVASLDEFITTAPRTPADLELTDSADEFDEDSAKSPWMRNSPMYKVMEQAVRRPMTAMQARDFETASRYWLGFWPSWNDRTRTSVVATFTSLADMLSHGMARELMASETNITPVVTYRDGMVIVVDVSIQEYLQIGRLIQGLWKYVFQRTILRRDATQWPRPVFLWADEGQNFISPFDYQFQAVARSARACAVMLTQNINNIRAVLGHGAQASAEALLGMYQTRIFHANPDAETNKWAAETIAQDWMVTSNFGTNLGEHQYGLNAGGTQALHYRIQPVEFQRLRTGGPENHNHVDAIIFRGGRRWRATGESYLRTIFYQD